MGDLHRKYLPGTEELSFVLILKFGFNPVSTLKTSFGIQSECFPFNHLMSHDITLLFSNIFCVPILGKCLESNISGWGNLFETNL